MPLVRLLDPTFEYLRAAGRLSGEIVRDLADSVLIPFNTSDYGYAMQRLIKDLDRTVQSSPAGSYANLSKTDQIRGTGQTMPELSSVCARSRACLLGRNHCV